MSRHASLALVLFAAVSLFAQDSNPVSSAAATTNTTAPAPKVVFKTMIPVVYNTEAENKQLHGRVDLAVLFNEKGLVDKVDVLSGDPVLGANASNFVKLWEIKPHVVDGVARPVKLDYSLQFVYKSVSDEVPETDTGTPAHLVLSENSKAANRLRNRPKFHYPQAALDAHFTGLVVLAASIGPDGKVKLLVPLAGNEMFVPFAMDTVKEWVFEPLLFKGKPIAFNTRIKVDYKLESPFHY